MSLIFDEATFIDGNIFKYEQRLHTHLNKYIENGTATLVTYYSIRESATTVDRGLRDIDQLFGKQSPLRFNKIRNFPLYNFEPTNPENTDEQQVEDIKSEGSCVIIPSTIVPKQYDFFIINHLKMRNIFMVKSVTYDTMKVDGFYKIEYTLMSTSEENYENLEKQTVENYETDLNAIGSDVNPIIQEDSFNYKKQLERMISQLIESYKALFYNQKHNCFIYHDQQTGMDMWDMCANEFMANHSIMNNGNDTNVVCLHEKVRDIQMPFFYQNSIFKWIELGAPSSMVQNFHFILNYADGYPDSSFVMYGEGDIRVIQPLSLQQVGINSREYCYLDNEQLNSLLEKEYPPINDFEKLIWNYMYNMENMSIKNISIHMADALISSIRHIDLYLYTPIIIYVIRQMLRLN